MSTLHNTALTTARAWRSHIANKEWDALRTLFHPSATIWFSGVTTPGDYFNPFAGSLPFAERLAALAQALPPEFSLETISESVSVDEGRGEGTVWYEVAAHGKGPEEGQTYENTVAIKVTVDREGRIVSVREYLDIVAVQKYLAAGKKEASVA